MALFSKKVPESVEVWLANLIITANLPDSDLGCRMVFPPTGGIIAGARCGSPADAKVHETGHPYFGPSDMIKKTCDSGHLYLVPAEMPDIHCQICRVNAEFPGWKRRPIGIWDKVPIDQRPQ